MYNVIILGGVPRVRVHQSAADALGLLTDDLGGAALQLRRADPPAGQPDQIVPVALQWELEGQADDPIFINPHGCAPRLAGRDFDPRNRALHRWPGETDILGNGPPEFRTPTGAFGAEQLPGLVETNLLADIKQQQRVKRAGQSIHVVGAVRIMTRFAPGNARAHATLTFYGALRRLSRTGRAMFHRFGSLHLDRQT